jgi:hypothetical protein
MDRGPVASQPLKGKSRVKMSQMVTNRRSRSRFRVRIVGSSSISWVQILEDWGASIKVVVEDILDPIKDIRHLLSNLPTITLRQALLLVPLGPWDGGVCLQTSIHPMMPSYLPHSLRAGVQPSQLSLRTLVSRKPTLYPFCQKAYYLSTRRDWSLSRTLPLAGSLLPLAPLLITQGGLMQFCGPR